MWSALCVTLAEILEVRGSNLTEDEAWVLLYAIGRQLKNVPEEVSRDFVIVHDNVQLHRNGGLSIKFISRQENAFPELNRPEHAVENALVYSLGMSLLFCLQNPLRNGEYVDISGDLQSLITMMVSPECAARKLEKITNHERFRTGNWELHVTECFKDLYKSIFGSMSDMPFFEDFSQSVTPEEPKRVSSEHKAVQVGEDNTSANVKHGEIEPIDKVKTMELQLRGQEEKSPQSKFIVDHNSPAPNENALPIPEKGNASPSNPESMLFRRGPPLQLDLCQMASDFKHGSHVTVEYLDRSKMRINLNILKMTCAHVLGVSVYHLITPMDPCPFSLSILKDGEYIILDPNATIDSVASTFFHEAEPHFFLRLKFVPDDLNSVRDNHLVKAMYLQTRRDILDGYINCATEEALLLAAYSLQYELGDTKQPSSNFRIRDYIPPQVLSRHGLPYIRTSLQCLHARLRGISRASCQNLYLRKAMELSDFGSHLIYVFLVDSMSEFPNSYEALTDYFSSVPRTPETQKCHQYASCQLLVGPNGLKLIQLKGDERIVLYSFSWDDLDKVSYKNNTISLIAKNKAKVKFYVKKEKRSKYIVLMLGEAHKFHRFHDFQSADQFTHPMAPTGVNRIIPSITITSQTPHQSVNDNERADSVQQETRTIEETSTLSPLFEREGSISISNPEITPYEPSSDERKSSGMQSGWDQETSVKSHPAYARVNKPKSNHTQISKDHRHPDHSAQVIALDSRMEEQDDVSHFSPRDIPPPIYEDVPGFSDEISEVADSHEIHDFHNPDVGDIEQLVASTSDSKVQEDVYARPQQPLFLEPNQTPELVMQDVYAYPNKPKNAQASVSAIQEDVYAKPHKPKAIATQNAPNLEDMYARPHKVQKPIKSEASAHEDVYAYPLKSHDTPDMKIAMAKQHRTMTGKTLTKRHDLHTQPYGYSSVRHVVPSTVETGSRGEGDGISNFSGPDQPFDSLLNKTGISAASTIKGDPSANDVIPEAVTDTIADFEEFKRRMAALRNATGSSSLSAQTETLSSSRS